MPPTSVATPTPVGAASDWTALGAGAASTCGTRADGTLWCWGVGLVGDGATALRETPTAVAPGRSWQAVAPGSGHSCALSSDGSVWCWGDNDSGQLGHGTLGAKATPTQVGEESAWRQVAAGGYHACALRQDGSLACFGLNSSGQLGVDSDQAAATPVAAPADPPWTTVAAGDHHTCGIRTDGSAWCWGKNDLGAVGDKTNLDKLVPVPLEPATDWQSLALGPDVSCGRRGDSSVWCWGGEALSAPRRFDGEWIAVSQLDGNACGLDAMGAVYCDRLPGDSFPTYVAEDRLVDRDLRATTTAGARSAPAGALWCWGSNAYGQLGIGVAATSNTPRPRSIPEVPGAGSWSRPGTSAASGPTGRSGAGGWIDVPTTQGVVSRPASPHAGGEQRRLARRGGRQLTTGQTWAYAPFLCGIRDPGHALVLGLRTATGSSGDGTGGRLEPGAGHRLTPATVRERLTRPARPTTVGAMVRPRTPPEPAVSRAARLAGLLGVWLRWLLLAACLGQLGLLGLRPLAPRGLPLRPGVDGGRHARPLLRLLQGQPLYGPPSVDFVSYLYTPLYPAVVAAPRQALRPPLRRRPPGLDRVARRGHGARVSRRAAGGGARRLRARPGGAPGGRLPLHRRLVRHRPQRQLYLALVTGGLYLVAYHHARLRSSRWRGVIMALAFLTKQTDHRLRPVRGRGPARLPLAQPAPLPAHRRRHARDRRGGCCSAAPAAGSGPTSTACTRTTTSTRGGRSSRRRSSCSGTSRSPSALLRPPLRAAHRPAAPDAHHLLLGARGRRRPRHLVRGLRHPVGLRQRLHPRGGVPGPRARRRSPGAPTPRRSPRGRAARLPRPALALLVTVQLGARCVYDPRPYLPTARLARRGRAPDRAAAARRRGRSSSPTTRSTRCWPARRPTSTAWGCGTCGAPATASRAASSSRSSAAVGARGDGQPDPVAPVAGAAAALPHRGGGRRARHAARLLGRGRRDREGAAAALPPVLHGARRRPAPPPAPPAPRRPPLALRRATGDRRPAATRDSTTRREPPRARPICAKHTPP